MSLIYVSLYNKVSVSTIFLFLTIIFLLNRIHPISNHIFQWKSFYETFFFLFCHGSCLVLFLAKTQQNFCENGGNSKTHWKLEIVWIQLYVSISIQFLADNYYFISNTKINVCIKIDFSNLFNLKNRNLNWKIAKFFQIKILCAISLELVKISYNLNFE